MHLPKVFPLIAVAALVSTISTGCISKTDLAPKYEVYAGRWVARGDRYIEISMDGSGSMKLPNSSIEGGTSAITDTDIIIAFGPMQKKFRITQEPSNTSGTWTMKLDGITYTKEE
jgi:hypothetical protein